MTKHLLAFASAVFLASAAQAAEPDTTIWRHFTCYRGNDYVSNAARDNLGGPCVSSGGRIYATKEQCEEAARLPRQTLARGTTIECLSKTEATWH